MILGAILGALLAWASLLIGLWWSQRRKPSTKCGCGHDVALHDLRTDKCDANLRGRATRFDHQRIPIDWEIQPCGCRQYTGAVPESLRYRDELREILKGDRP